VLAWLARKLRPDEHPSKEPPLATDNWQPATGKETMKPWLVLLLALWAGPAAAGLVDGVAAVVGGRVITKSEVEELASMSSRSAAAAPGDRTSKALESLIETALVEREAERQGINVTDEELEQAVADVRKRNNMDDRTFREAIASQGMKYDAYLRTLRSQVLKAKVTGRALRSKLKVGDEALREYYLKNVAEFRDPESVRLYHIQISASRGIAAAEAIRARALAGESFSALARQVSEGPGAAKGGDMGYLAVKKLAGEVWDAVSGLPEGGVSHVVAMGGAFHLFYAAEWKGGRIPAFEELRDQIQDRYYKEKEEELYRSWMDSLKEKAGVERML